MVGGVLWPSGCSCRVFMDWGADVQMQLGYPRFCLCPSERTLRDALVLVWAALPIARQVVYPRDAPGLHTKVIFIRPSMG